MVRGAGGPWGRPRGLMEMRAIRRIAGAHRHLLLSPPLPNDSMTRAHGQVQPGWGKVPNRG
jgi:hypothetical protein